MTKKELWSTVAKYQGNPDLAAVAILCQCELQSHVDFQNVCIVWSRDERKRMLWKFYCGT